MKKALLILLSLLTALSPAYAVDLPDLGDASSAVISPAEERKLGEDLMREARRHLAFVQDAEITSYVQNLGQRLVAHSDGRSQPFQFHVVDDASINAFAAPGGFIVVHTGLLMAAKTEAELASVLAHEIAHITQRHIPRMLAEQKRTSIPAMAALLASVLLASAGHKVGDAGVAVTAATIRQQGINFTRANEEEADRIGVRILADAGFDPRAMPAFFERMQSLNRHAESDLPVFLRTHPVTTTRISDTRGRAEQYPYRQVPDSLEFQLVRAKLRARAPGEANEIVRGFAQNLADGRGASMEAERYGYVVALLRARRYDQARSEIKKLTESSPASAPFRLLEAETEMAAGRITTAISLYANAYKRHPNYYPLALEYAEALLKANKNNDAEAVLRETLKTRRHDPTLHQLLAQATRANGKVTESHQALAEYHYLMGNFAGAIEQLQIARRSAGDNFYLQSSIDARLQSIREELKQYQGARASETRLDRRSPIFPIPPSR